MKRIYISGPITNDPDYMTKFEAAENELREMGYTSIVNPAKVNANLPSDFDHRSYMECSLAQLRCCEAVLMLKGWAQSKGAAVEKAIAETRRMEILYQK